MRYLVVIHEGEPFYTDYFLGNLIPSVQFIAFDLVLEKHTRDGVNWFDTEFDHL